MNLRPYQVDGAASKELMVKTARDKGYEVGSEDEADALALLDLVLKGRRDVE